MHIVDYSIHNTRVLESGVHKTGTHTTKKRGHAGVEKELGSVYELMTRKFMTQREPWASAGAAQREQGGSGAPLLPAVVLLDQAIGKHWGRWGVNPAGLMHQELSQFNVPRERSLAAHYRQSSVSVNRYCVYGGHRRVYHYNNKN